MNRGTAGRREILVEVQALRALAVILVVVYHVWPDRLSGGFVGVDVFFVISGFLITAHLLREYESRGRILLRAFWVRRIRRLLPAALFVLAVCGVLAFTVLPAVVRVETMRQVGAAAAYVLNWVLASDSVDYLASDNAATVVQHYWTLSVEEQFYIVWPVILVAALWLAVRLGRRRAPAIVVGVAATAVGIASFVYSVFLTAYTPTFAFFSTPARAWEFAAGAVFAAVIARWPQVVDAAREHFLARRAALPTLVGGGAMVASALWLSSESPFPGWRAAFPVVGATLVIAGGRPSAFGLDRLLGSRPVQFVGDISYSLYLWHWPLILALPLVVERRPAVWDGALIIAASMLLAAATWYFVEGPARSAAIFTGRRLPAFALAVFGAIVFVSVYGATSMITRRQVEARRIAWEQRLGDPAGCFGANAMLGTADCPDRFVLDPNQDLAAAAADLDTRTWCLTWHDEDWMSCERGDLDGPNGTVALVGDSHAAALLPALDRYLARKGIRLVTYLRFSCSGLKVGVEDFGDWSLARQENDCRVWSARVRAELAVRDDIDAVLFNNFTSTYVKPDRIPELLLTVDDIVETWSEIIAAGKQVIVLKDPPTTVLEEAPACLARYLGETGPCSRPRAVAVAWDPLLEAAGQFDGQVPVIDPTEAFCDDVNCYAVIGDVVVYSDTNHITGTYASTLIGHIGQELLDTRRFGRW